MRVLETQRGLLFRHGNYVKLLPPGKYWIGPSQNVMLFSLEDPFKPSIPLDLFLKDPLLAAELEVIDVADRQIAIHFVDEHFRAVLSAGKHAFWKGLHRHRFVTVDLDEPKIQNEINRALFTRPELKEYLVGYAVEAHEKALLFIDKVYQGLLEPGNYFFWKGVKSVNLLKADLRRQQFEISGQDILTKDKAALRINFVLHFKIVDPEKTLQNVKDPEAQLYILAQLALRDYVGSKTLDEILERKDEIGTYVLSQLVDSTRPLGMEVMQTGVKDVILPGDMKEIMNQVLIAEKKAQANVIMRREETASTRSLLNTAKLMEENQLLLRLKELEYVERISEKINQITLSGGGQLLEQLRQIFIPTSQALPKSESRPAS